MASINKLSIRGIRAFSPEDQEQVLEFYFPITVIVGHNGCGKTTIIEALKYAITGAFPPGCGRSGNAFVHDPKAIVQTTVKANVKLRFTSRSGQSMVVVRSMELTQKKTTQTFKQLDGVLRMMDPETGERVSLSHKCTELDKQIPQLLGVSKPILEHVVFCHQEDSSWPLMEGAVLKKRFDDIFDSTKYSKALQIFRQTEKDFLSKVKDLKVEVASFSAHKQAADAFMKELQEQNEQVESLDDMKKELSEEISTLDERMKSLQETVAAVDRINDLIETRKNEINQKMQVSNKQREMLEEDLTQKHSIVDLKGMLDDFYRKMVLQVDEKRELEQKVNLLQEEIENARQEEMTLTNRIGKLTAEKEVYEKNTVERYKKMERIAQTYTLNLTQLTMSQGNASFASTYLSQTQGEVTGDNDVGTLVSISAEDMHRFFLKLEEKKAELVASINDHRTKYRSEEDNITAVLTELGGKLQAIDNEKTRLAKERSELESEMKELKDTTGPRMRKVDVDEQRRKANRLAEERDALNKDPRRHQITKEIRDFEDAMEKLKRKIEDESAILESLKQTADSRSSLLALQEQCEKDIDILDEIVRDEAYKLSKFDIVAPTTLPRDGDDEGDQLMQIFNSMNEVSRDKLRVAAGRLDEYNSDVHVTEKIIAEKSAVLANNQKSLATLRTNLSSLTTSLRIVQKTVEELREHESRLGLVLSVDEEAPREVIKYINDRLDELEEDDSPDVNVTKVSRRILKRLRKMAKVVDSNNESKFDVICPCCKRLMEENEIAVFQESIAELMNNDSLVETSNNDKDRVLYESMRRSIEGKVDDLRDLKRMTGEAAELEKEIKRLQDDLSHHREALGAQCDKKDREQKVVDELSGLVDTIRRWTEDAGRVVDKKMEIKQKVLDLKATSADSSRDLKTVDRQITEMREEREMLSAKVARLHKETSDLNNKISEISNSAAKNEQNAREKEEKYAAEMKSVERRKDINLRMQQIGEEEKKLSDQIAPLQLKKKKKESERDQTRSYAAQEEESLQTTLSVFKSDVESLQNLSLLIDSFLSSEKLHDLEQSSSKVSGILKKIESKKNELQEIEPKLRSLARAVDDQERHKKLLMMNIDILEADERRKVLEKEIRNLKAERDAIDGGSTAYDEFVTLRGEKEKLLQKKSNYEGRFSSLVEQIRALKRKLSSPEYKDVDEQYRVANIKLFTTKVAAEDLRKYGNALDKALLQFHGVKIREINKIIRELWMMTYKGQDITDIEIQSGMEPGSKAAKSYNYRVVMRKGGAVMDMRGRCSAGQRVLACIVIRLALAETFGVNCGVVALDEPTVNLDYDNKKGLAIALSHIVAARAQQRNFQLIMITHDEEFVGMMKLELSSMTGFSMPERYFQVCREEGADGKFYSKIHAMDWDELL